MNLGRFGCAAVGLLLGTACVGAARGQTYYAELSAQDNSEVLAWTALYWDRMDNGGGSPGAGFSFTNPLMNSQLFNPVRSARPTLELLGSIDSNACDHLYELPGVSEEGSGDTLATIRDFMFYGEISTEEGTPEDWDHFLLVATVPAELAATRWAAGEWTYEDVGGYHVSVGLPLSEVSGVVADAVLAYNLSAETEQLLSSLIVTGGYWRSQCTDIPQWRSLITGETSTAEQFRAILDGYLAFNPDPARYTQLIQANFGSFGELPVIQLTLSDCYVLLDPTNGNLSGPFQTGSALNAGGLLSQHSGAYEAGSAVRYYNASGCPIIVATSWHDSPPCPFYNPFCSYTPTYPAGDWACSEYGLDGNGNVACVCDFRGTGTGGGTPATVPIRQICRCGPGGSGCSGQFPAGPGVPTPPAGCAPAPATPPTCKEQYLY